MCVTPETTFNRGLSRLKKGFLMGRKGSSLQKSSKQIPEKKFTQHFKSHSLTPPQNPEASRPRTEKTGVTAEKD